MENEMFFRATMLLFVLLNPFLMTAYLMDLIRHLDHTTFRSVLVRGAVIATAVFCIFALSGDAIFDQLLQVRFASFLLFGGVIFLILGINYMREGPEALGRWRPGPVKHIAGSIAMPFMIGPGTVSASVYAGVRLPNLWALASVVLAVALSVIGVLFLKRLHDWVQQRHAALVDRYLDIVGRVSALVIGTIAVEMILQGIDLYLEHGGDLPDAATALMP